MLGKGSFSFMKASELRKIYLASVHLYGTITSTQLYKLITHYQLDVTKEQLLKDLATRVDKLTNNYYVGKKSKNSFFLVDTSFSNEEFNDLLVAKRGKPFYYPPTYEDFLKYSDPNYFDANAKKAFDKLNRFLEKNSDIEKKFVPFVAEAFISKLTYYSFNDAIELFKNMKFDFAKESDADKFFAILSEASNNLRIPSNNGFTPLEMFEVSGVHAVADLTDQFLKALKEAFYNGDIDPYSFLRDFEYDETIPENIRAPFVRALKDIIKDIESIPKA